MTGNRFEAAAQWTKTTLSSADGSLLTESAWTVRHRILSFVAAAQIGICLVDIPLEHPGDTVGWAGTLATVALALASWVPRWPRRIRQYLLAVALGGSATQLNRHVGNVTGLTVVDVVLLSLYQDWTVLAVAFVAATASLAVVLFDPDFSQSFASYQAESPLRGSLVRFVGVTAAVAVALIGWRHSGLVARDPLTGLLSRYGLERSFDRQRNGGEHPAVWVLDVDGFSLYNERLGAAHGDELLRRVALRVRAASPLIGDNTEIARLAGDTFAVTQPNGTDADQLRATAQRVQRAVEHGTEMIGGHVVPVRVSIGVCCGCDGRPADVIANASAAMRRAKSQGVNRISVRGPRSAGEQRAVLAGEVYDAIRAGQLELFYQPIVDMRTGQPVAAEALARWHHPDRGMLSAGSFMPQAEADSALMADLSRHLAEQLFDQIERWDDRFSRGFLPEGISYNLAAIRLGDPAFLADATEMMRQYPRVASRLCVEITEGALADVHDEIPDVVDVLHGLKQLGCKLALDDFGTGHSSLAHLRDFPVDVLKIDRSFVSAAGAGSAIDRSIIEAAADVAAGANVRVVCEGVETTAERDMLLRMTPGMFGQGLLWAGPMPADQLETFADP